MESTEISLEIAEACERGSDARVPGQGFFTQEEDWNDLKAIVRDAAFCHFRDTLQQPKLIRLHFVRDEILLV